MKRVFYMNVLRHAVLNFEMGVPVETVEEWPDDDMALAIEQLHPPLTASRQARIERTRDSLIQVNALSCPPDILLHPPEAVLNPSHDGVPTFQGPRYLEMVRELRQSTTGAERGGAPRGSKQRIRLATCVGYCGLYRTCVFGRFVVTKWAGRTRVEALNVYSKVEERSKVDEHVAP